MNGKYTQIENEVLEGLISSNLSASELKVALFILRKTNGFHKDTDEISFSQFIEETGLSRQTISNCLAQLKLVNIIRLVKKGVSNKRSNEWAFNKDVLAWKLVKRARLVKFPIQTSQKSGKKLVNISRHTKESTKESTKEIYMKDNSLEWLRSEEAVTDLMSDVKSYFLTEAVVKGELLKMNDWLEANGKKYKNYRAFARNWLRRWLDDNRVQNQKSYTAQSEESWRETKQRESGDVRPISDIISERLSKLNS